MMTFEQLLVVVSGTLSGLVAGVYYCFNVAIVPALNSIAGTQHIAAMQAINNKIKNPIFFLSFFGPALLLPLTAFLYRNRVQFYLLIAAAALHIIGSIGITIVGNIPLNERLDKLDTRIISESEAEQIRRAFQGAGSPWMRFHAVRAICAVIATGLIFVACLIPI